MKVVACVVDNNELIEIDYRKVLKLVSTVILLDSTGSLTGIVGHASGVDVAGITAPFIDLVSKLGYPVCYASMVKGALQMATGADHEGKKAITSAVKGYLVVKFAPQVFDFLDDFVLFK